MADAAAHDWVAILDGLPEAAISAACEGYLRDQPRRRPAPGDILARAKGYLQQHAETAVKPSDRDAWRVVQWATQTRRMSIDDAWQALAGAHDMAAPEWLPDDPVQRYIYAVLHHPECREPDPEAVRDYRRGVRA